MPPRTRVKPKPSTRVPQTPGPTKPGASAILQKTPGHVRTQPAPINGTAKVGEAFKGSTALAGSHVKNNPAVPALLLGSFLIIALAKVRGQSHLDVPKALFGGFILALILLGINMWSGRVAVGFAALVFIQVLLEFGPAALGGVFGKGGTTLPTSSLPVVSGINQNVPTGLEGAIGGDINSHPDSLPAGQGSLSDVFGRNK